VAPAIEKAMPPILARVMRMLRHPAKPAALEDAKPFSSKAYWSGRYAAGRTSGGGSYGKLAAFKAEVLNAFTRDKAIASVIEFGCGDGNQLKLADYPSYLGLDVSEDAVSMCRAAFGHDTTKSFKLLSEYRGEGAELALSLDVIYHLVEDEVFADYMNVLFDAASRFVIVYSSDTDENEPGQAVHVRHREFTRWVREHRRDWALEARIPNRYPCKRRFGARSFADFHVYRRVGR
jgi:hypothetical protein